MKAAGNKRFFSFTNVKNIFLNHFFKDIAQKNAESSYTPLKENVNSWVYQINQHIIQSLNNGPK